MEKKHAILLVRVSTSVQDYEAQIYDLKEYAKRFGYSEFHIIDTKETAFADMHAKIGTNEMFKYIQSNPQYNTIFITELNRLARRQSILHTLKEQLVNNRIQLYIKDSDYRLLDDNDQLTPQAETMFTLYGLFSESEVKQKLERFKRKKRELMETGYSISGPPLFGYERQMTASKKNTLVINEEQAEIVRKLFSWYLNGYEGVRNPSIKRMAYECIRQGLHPYTHSKRNVNKLLKEEGYTGFKTTNNKYKNAKFGLIANESEYLTANNNIKYPVIIDKETFQAVQDKLKSNVSKSDKETKHVTILARLLTCPSCGRSLQGNYRIRDGFNKNTYRCTSRGDTKECTKAGSLPMTLGDSVVWGLIKADLPALSQQINEINPDLYLVELESQLANFIQRENEISKDIEENVQVIASMGKANHPSVMELIVNTGKKIAKLESELEKIQQEKARIESDKLLIRDKQDNVEAVINDNLEMIEKSKELLRKYINAFVHRIKILEHSRTHTVLEVTIRDYTYLTNHSEHIPKGFPVVKDFEYIIIDKTVTRQIKCAYYKEDLVFNDDQEHPEISLDEAIPIIKNELKTNNFKIGTPMEYQKLLF